MAYKLSTKLLQNSVESAIRENDSNSHRSAASSLLVLTCDAVSQRYQLREPLVLRKIPDLQI